MRTRERERFMDAVKEFQINRLCRNSLSKLGHGHFEFCYGEVVCFLSEAIRFYQIIEIKQALNM